MGRRGSARGARAKGNQGFGRSINTCFSISTCCFIVVVVVVIIMLIRLEPVEVQPCCRPLRAAQFLPLSAVSILSWDHHHHRYQYYHHHHHVHQLIIININIIIMSPSILVPGFHLSISQAKLCCQLHPVLKKRFA